MHHINQTQYINWLSLSTALYLAVKTTIALNLFCTFMRSNSVSQHLCIFLSFTEWSWDRWYNFLKQNTTVEPGTNPDVLIFNAGITPDFILSFSAEDRCYKNNLHRFRFIFWISVKWSFLFGKWNEYNVILEINPAIEIILGKRSPNLLFAQAMNSNCKIANFSKINWKSSTSQVFCSKDQFWPSDFPQSMQREHVFKNIIVHYGCTNT